MLENVPQFQKIANTPLLLLPQLAGRQSSTPPAARPTQTCALGL